MFTAEVKFYKVGARSSTPDALHAATSLMSAWHWNGQTVGEWQLAATKEVITFYVSIPERASLGKKFANRYVNNASSKLSEMGLAKPSVQIIGHDPESAPVCSCKIRDSFILFTTFLHIGSPLRCGLCFGMIPLYRIPPTNHSAYSDVISWEQAFKA